MATSEHLLDSRRMARFVADGYLRFDAVVPEDVNRRACAEIEAGAVPSPFHASRHAPQTEWPGQPFEHLWDDSDGIGAVFRLPAVRGIIVSLVGSDPLYDHHYAHVLAPHTEVSQVWHADSMLDLRWAFDIQLFYFPHDTPREMGGTMLLPGSQYRRVNERDVACYQNFRGQLATVCPAGTIVVCHHGIWHCGQANRTDRKRLMFKLRLNPSEPQRLLWAADDLDDPVVRADVYDILNGTQPWFGNEGRLEVLNRVRQWRYLTGDESFDVEYWLTRIEHLADPGPAALPSGGVIGGRRPRSP